MVSLINTLLVVALPLAATASQITIEAGGSVVLEAGGGGGALISEERVRAIATEVAIEKVIAYQTSLDFCGEGTYWASASAACEPCDAQCRRCMGPAASQCIQCTDTDRHLVAGTCTLLHPTPPPPPPPCEGMRMVRTVAYADGGFSGCYCSNFYNYKDRGTGGENSRQAFETDCLADDDCTGYYYGDPASGTPPGSYGGLCGPAAVAVSSGTCIYGYIIEVSREAWR
jgi:hypothetical protein